MPHCQGERNLVRAFSFSGNVGELALATALDDVLVVCGKGFAAESLRDVDWIGHIPIVYWGDIDTHGFAILNMVRTFAPQTRSVMMDASTLHRYLDLCVDEPSPTNAQLPNLTDAETEALALLAEDGRHLRLEQERIEWLWACSQPTNALDQV